MSGLHRDILNGDDETMDPVDFLPSECVCISLGLGLYARRFAHRHYESLRGVYHFTRHERV